MSDEEELAKKVTVGGRVGIRNFVNVVDAIKIALPKSYPKTPEIKARLTALQVQASRRSSSDGHQHLWDQGAEILSQTLGELDCSWKKQVYAIWAKRK